VIVDIYNHFIGFVNGFLLLVTNKNI